MLKLIGYDYAIHYRAGKHNNVPDALSRKGEFAAITGVSQPIHSYVADIQVARLLDIKASNVIQQLTQGQDTKPYYSLCNSKLYYKRRLFVPVVNDWRVKVLTKFHGGLTGGHAGVSRTHKRISRSFAWPGLLRDVKRFVAECHTCQQNHYETIRPLGYCNLIAFLRVLGRIYPWILLMACLTLGAKW